MSLDVLKTYFSPSTRIGGPATRRSKKDAVTSPPKPYLTWLVAVFIAWKSLLLAVAYASPGPGYDTSTRILFDQYNVPSHSWLSRSVENLTLRLTRWDAIYFSTSSERGHLYEQEWAFSWFMARLTSVLSNAFPLFVHKSPIIRHALTGVYLSHLSHLGAVITLYSLVRRIIPTQETKRQIAFTAACLHIISPAGLFLSTPNAEGAFALTTFLGILCYIRSHEIHKSPTAKAAYTLASGLSFALSTLIRSNGLLHGTLFLSSALTSLRTLLTKSTTTKSTKPTTLLHLLTTLLSGSLLALAFALPQTLAYLEFCSPTASRPWCSHALPSIYTWVQKHYWNVGFLAYWTPGNIPLFLLAAPVLAVLFATGHASLFRPKALTSRFAPADVQSPEVQLFEHILTQLAIPQFILSSMALTSFHVQIINRICSGCALWYLVLAVAIQRPGVGGESGVMGFFGRRGEVLVRLMVGYAVVQGGLYAAFLPPA